MFVTDDMPGWRRVATESGYAYFTEKGKLIRARGTLERLQSLAIPPAYTDVWICPLANGHLQATGRDAKGRKQYRYHAAWSAQRNQVKFDRLTYFAKKLPAIRRRVKHDLERGDTTLETVVAAIIRLLDTTALRVGNDQYSEANDSYGLTTLRRRHVKTRSDRIQLEFKGKSGVWQHLEVIDRRVSHTVRRCQELPGQRLFQFTDSTGEVRHVRSEHVNAYLHDICGESFTAKDFRTWHASVLALDLALQGAHAENRLTLPDLVRKVAKHLGNTGAVCRKYYIHPKVLQLCEFGLHAPLESLEMPCQKAAGLYASERRFLKLLAKRHETPS